MVVRLAFIVMEVPLLILRPLTLRQSRGLLIILRLFLSLRAAQHRNDTQHSRDYRHTGCPSTVEDWKAYKAIRVHVLMDWRASHEDYLWGFNGLYEIYIGVLKCELEGEGFWGVDAAWRALKLDEPLFLVVWRLCDLVFLGKLFSDHF